jgi:uncharacterized protein involved in tolerance to divalent cations
MDEFVCVIIIIALLIAGGLQQGMKQNADKYQKLAVDHNAAVFEVDKYGQSIFLWNDEVNSWRSTNVVVKVEAE